MAPLVAASLISLGGTVLGGLFGRKPKAPSSPDFYFVDTGETVKDNSTLYLIVGLVSIVLLIIVVFLIVRSFRK